MDKSLILLKIKKFTCFNQNSFAHHFEKKTQRYEQFHKYKIISRTSCKLVNCT